MTQQAAAKAGGLRAALGQALAPHPSPSTQPPSSSCPRAVLPTQLAPRFWKVLCPLARHGGFSHSSVTSAAAWLSLEGTRFHQKQTVSLISGGENRQSLPAPSFAECRLPCPGSIQRPTLSWRTGTGGGGEFPLGSVLIFRSQRGGRSRRVTVSWVLSPSIFCC